MRKNQLSIERLYASQRAVLERELAKASGRKEEL